MSLKIQGPKRDNNKPFTQDYISQFRDFLHSNGYEPDPKKGLVTDGSIGPCIFSDINHPNFGVCFVL